MGGGSRFWGENVLCRLRVLGAGARGGMKSEIKIGFILCYNKEGLEKKDIYKWNLHRKSQNRLQVAMSVCVCVRESTCVRV